MKCTNKKDLHGAQIFRRTAVAILPRKGKIPHVKRGMLAAVFSLLITLTGCGELAYDMAYDPDYPVSSFRVVTNDRYAVGESFAAGLCVTANNVTENTEFVFGDLGAAGLFDLSNSKIIYANNIHGKLYPASMTKVMTALVALKYGNLDDMLVASENAVIDEYGVQTFGLRAGDRMTLDQALHILLIKSANDVGIMIAEHIGGSVEGFAKLMNDEAARLGATNSHFVNPHGLHDEEHYTTAYDMYLIFQEAMQYDEFKQIIAMESYTTVYTNADGNASEETVRSTIQYLTRNYTAPDNITVIGGKTGTTNAAGNCLVLLVKDTSGNQYIAVIMRARERGTLYEKMNALLSEIYKQQ
ncbi:MAG: D-alanyl-D-alanine carboxypeptidase [Lachnospiraceae bacterium]|nr:D-alanyl-D-alanine carboxypeptidase [Lachnospiraceae bacterium]